MLIFWRLVLAHFIADFSLQTNRIAVWKRESRWGMFVHSMTHPIVSVLLLTTFTPHGPSWVYLSWPWVQTPWFALNGWMCILLISVFHWLEDEWRVWSIQQTGSPDSTGFFLWDQVVHLTIILAVSPTIPMARNDSWVLPVLCVVILAHFVSVLIFFIENDLGEESQVLGDQKYRYIGERLLGAGLFLLPSVLFLLAFAWLGWLFYLHYYRSKERSWVHVLVGNLAVVLLGLLTRGLLFS
jgi:hypothetical protein